MNVIKKPSPSRKAAMALRLTGTELLCVTSMEKMKKVWTSSLRSSCLSISRVSIFRIPLICKIEIPTSSRTLTHPTLLIASTGYIISVTINYPEQMKPFAPDLRVENVDGGHWLQLEKAKEVNTILEKFVEDQSKE